MLTLGSYGIGWLASSSVLIRNLLFIMARTTPVAVVVATMLLCAGAVLMFRAWLLLRQHLTGGARLGRNVKEGVDFVGDTHDIRLASVQS